MITWCVCVLVLALFASALHLEHYKLLNFFLSILNKNFYETVVAFD